MKIARYLLAHPFISLLIAAAITGGIYYFSFGGSFQSHYFKSEIDLWKEREK